MSLVHISSLILLNMIYITLIWKKVIINSEITNFSAKLSKNNLNYIKVNFNKYPIKFQIHFQKCIKFWKFNYCLGITRNVKGFLEFLQFLVMLKPTHLTSKPLNITSSVTNEVIFYGRFWNQKFILLFDKFTGFHTKSFLICSNVFLWAKKNIYLFNQSWTEIMITFFIPCEHQKNSF